MIYPIRSLVAVLLATSITIKADYVAPVGAGTGAWANAYTKAKTLVAKMTLEEKLNLTIIGNGVPRLGFPGFVSADGSNGPRGYLGHSAFVAVTTMSASFDRDLIYSRAIDIGEEYYDAGYSLSLGPMMNMMRSQEGGRNMMGPDPYLTGVAASLTVAGMQAKKVGTVIKHFIGNEQQAGQQVTSVEIDDKTLHEVYVWPFAECIEVQAVSVMSAYPATNGTYDSENPDVLGRLLKTQLGFQGFVTSDFLAVRSGAPSFLAGLDQQFGPTIDAAPGPTTIIQPPSFALGTALTADVTNGTVPMSRVDDSAVRIIAAWYLLGQDSGFPALVNGVADVQRNHKEGIRKAGAASTVLLKNSKGALPLKRPKALAIFGVDASSDPNGINLYHSEINGQVLHIGAGANGTMPMGYGSGWQEFPYLISPYEGHQQRGRKDNTVIQAVMNNNMDATDYLASQTTNDACLVYILSISGEVVGSIEDNRGDRNNITAYWGGDALVERVASQCSNTIVVIHSVGAITMPWSDHPNVTAIVFAGQPGQESGNSIIDVLYGDYNPSAKMPFTIAHNVSDYPAHVDPIPDNLTTLHSQTYPEKLLLDYRWFDAKNITPLFEFGYGLSYTTFSYSSISVSGAKTRFRRDQGDLYSAVYTVSASFKNTGSVAGAEVAQLYLSFPEEAGQPPKVLRGFEKAFLQPGKSASVTFPLRKKDISYWNVAKQSWVVASGKYTVHVGSSSRKLPYLPPLIPSKFRRQDHQTVSMAAGRG